MAAADATRPIVLLARSHDQRRAAAVRARRSRCSFGGFAPGARVRAVRSRAPGRHRSRTERRAGAGRRSGPEQLPRWAGEAGTGIFTSFPGTGAAVPAAIVAANLSRADALTGSKEGSEPVRRRQQRELRLDPCRPICCGPAEAVDEGHCHQMAPQMLPGLARARSRATRHWLRRSALLEARRRVAGRQRHVSRDMACALSARVARGNGVISIALIERDTAADEVPRVRSDAVLQRRRRPAGPVPVASPELRGPFAKTLAPDIFSPRIKRTAMIKPNT